VFSVFVLEALFHPGRVRYYVQCAFEEAISVARRLLQNSEHGPFTVL
jgi:hypothetical protein